MSNTAKKFDVLHRVGLPMTPEAKAARALAGVEQDEEFLTSKQIELIGRHDFEAKRILSVLKALGLIPSE